MKPTGIVGIVVAITVGLLLIGYLLPLGFTAYHSESKTTSTTLTTTGGITAIGTEGISINLTAVNASANATFALYDQGALVDTQLINLSETGTFVATGGSITVIPTAITANSATIDVAIPTDLRWDDGEVAMFGVIGILVLMGIMLAFIRLAKDAFDYEI